MITEFRCTECGGEFTDVQMAAALSCCPHCGKRYGAPRICYRDGKLVALDVVEPGEWVQVITATALLIENAKRDPMSRITIRIWQDPDGWHGEAWYFRLLEVKTQSRHSRSAGAVHELERRLGRLKAQVARLVLPEWPTR